MTERTLLYFFTDEYQHFFYMSYTDGQQLLYIGLHNLSFYESPVVLTDASGDGVGVGIGSRPAPGSRLDNVGAGAKRERALASSGILPVGAIILMLL